MPGLVGCFEGLSLSNTSELKKSKNPFNSGKSDDDDDDDDPLDDYV